MRSARLHSQDLVRTNQFVNTLLSKDDIKDSEKRDAPEAPKSQPMVNGNGLSFGKATRFSDPPAPPPQAPLPEKPDVPSLKRGPTERPKSGPPNTSPVRQDNLSQVIQLTEALHNVKRDFDSQAAQLRELEAKLQEERAARHLAEDLAKRLEESSHSYTNGAAKAPIDEPANVVPEDIVPVTEDAEATKSSSVLESADATALALQSRIDSMDSQMQEMKSQMEQWRQRCEVAESERDADRKTLAEMVVQLRAEEARRVAQESTRSRSRRNRKDSEPEEPTKAIATAEASKVDEGLAQSQLDGVDSTSELGDDPTLSRANTITPLNSRAGSSLQGRHHLQAGLPYASMMGVVLIGMGLMAYINGWQAPPARVEQ